MMHLYSAFYCVLLYTQSALQSWGGGGVSSITTSVQHPLDDNFLNCMMMMMYDDNNNTCYYSNISFLICFIIRFFFWHGPRSLRLRV